MGRRHNPDPVRVYADRVRWWPSADSRVGRQEQYFGSGPEDRAAFAVAKRAELARGGGNAIELVAPFLASIKVVGTRKAYEGDINNWGLFALLDDEGRRAWRAGVLDADSAISCSVDVHAVDRRAFVDCLDDAVAHGATEGIINSLNTALGAYLTWLEDNEHIALHPLSTRPRRKAVDKAKVAARRQNPTQHRVVEFVPDWAEVCVLAAIVAVIHGELGARAVRVLAGTGLRIAELVGLRVSDVNLATGTIRVTRQADRYNHWPAMVHDLKDHEIRTVKFWGIVSDDLRALIDGAGADGWLFPPTRDQKNWLDRLERAINDATVEEGHPWRAHGLRDHFATYCLKPTPIGFGYDVKTVSAWLGHASPEYTRRVYEKMVKGQIDEISRHLEVTARHPSEAT